MRGFPREISITIHNHSEHGHDESRPMIMQRVQDLGGFSSEKTIFIDLQCTCIALQLLGTSLNNLRDDVTRLISTEKIPCMLFLDPERLVYNSQT